MKSIIVIFRTIISHGQLALFLLLCSLTGCGAPTGEITGKVTYNEKPVNSGMVMFLVEGHSKPHYARIEKGGTYTIEDVPVGSAKVTVVSPDPNRPDPDELRRKKIRKTRKQKSGNQTPNSDWFPIPEKYSDLRKSNLTFTIKPGENSYDLPLK